MMTESVGLESFLMITVRECLARERNDKMMDGIV